MSNINDYYQKLSMDLLTYIQNEEYEKALSIIEDELQQPYIPNEHYINLLNTKDEIEEKIQENNYNNEIESLTKLQVWDKIFSSATNKIDLVYLNVFFAKFENQIDDVDFSIMQKILLDKNLANSEKTILISTLIDNNISHEFEYYNNYTKKTSKFRTDDLSNNESTIFANEIHNELEKHFLKDPSKFSIVNSLLQLLVIEFFPSKIIFDKNEIVKTIINIVNSLFSEEEMIDNEISKILKKFLN